MIAFMRGKMAARTTTYALLEVGGIGYKLAMPSGSLAALPSLGDDALVWTHLHVREDELTLFGFSTETEKDSFEHLITVSGVGPKVGLAVLSALSPDALAMAVASEDVALLSSVPGIGKKTAQRIILDLKGKLESRHQGGFAGRAVQPGNAVAEATEALLAMGFSSAEVVTALQGYDGQMNDAQPLLKYALRRLGGAL